MAVAFLAAPFAHTRVLNLLLLLWGENLHEFGAEFNSLAPQCLMGLFHRFALGRQCRLTF